MDKLGERLRHFRLENGWSKSAIAEQLGVSIPSIMRWEEGISHPNDYNLYKIDRLLAEVERPSTTQTTPRRITQLSLFAESRNRPIKRQ